MRTLTLGDDDRHLAPQAAKPSVWLALLIEDEPVTNR
jgi:hypothetical protein